MFDTSSEHRAALDVARDASLRVRHFAWFEGPDFPEGLGLWSGLETVPVTVLSGLTRQPVTRTYYGDCGLKIGDIPLVSDLTSQSVKVSMSQIADATQQLARGHDLRLARCEIHEMTISLETGLLSSPPVPSFVGIVDKAPINTPSAQQDGDISLTIRSDFQVMLSKKNPRKSSYESQKRRENDQFGLHSGAVATWKIPWGISGARSSRR